MTSSAGRSSRSLAPPSSEPPPARTSASDPRAGAPVLDGPAIAALAADMGAPALAGFLAEARRTHAALAAASYDLREARRMAHRLRGTAGTLGLARVAALAGAIEDAAAAGGDVVGLVARLGEAIATTDGALARSASSRAAPPPIPRRRSAPARSGPADGGACP